MTTISHVIAWNHCARNKLGGLPLPIGERVGVRGLKAYRKTLTPHPTPLPMGEGADRASLQSMTLSNELDSSKR